MEDYKKKAFTKKIANANKIQMIEILYEITLTYLEDALGSDFDINIEKADKCIDELINSVNVKNETGKTILNIYLFIKKQIQLSRVKKDKDAVKDIISILDIFKKAYESLSFTDLKPVMQNTEEYVYGFTYDSNLKLNSQSKSFDRGLKI